MTIPDGYDFMLRGALYGTKQAGHCWWQHLSRTLHNMGYECSTYGSSVYMNHAAGIYIWVHVDDGIVFSKTAVAMADLHHNLSSPFRIKWADGVPSIIGLQINQTMKGYLISQTQAIDGIIAAMALTCLSKPHL
ncbi:hypothetical protein O181_010380 [Austropuccinia psidii MF-1]|uniref:Reverse transcriptase Ty1/copia-type domain-containing protein n=1 Tax=Austropuccinia psidii MF-1 TaxID=1389203 RepID=A0A9Q3GKU6_9BASI|nr:hypothetical protein [Austropuccinia psidii MF-1]